MRARAGPAPPRGTTTARQTLVAQGAGFRRLGLGPGEPHVLRADLGVGARAGRGRRRRSLLAFAHLTDTHLLDAESPARVEWLDPFDFPDYFPVRSAFRPQETLTPFVLDAMVRQINALLVSELSGASLAFAINTGDTVDNCQLNELRWLLDTLDGGWVEPGSGGPAYEGVQRGNDAPIYYHPDDPSGDDYGRRAGFPAVPGLLAAARRPFRAAGLAVPWYAVYGNHDGLLQGDTPASPLLAAVAVGPVKVVRLPFEGAAAERFGHDLVLGRPEAWQQLAAWIAARTPGVVQAVTPDPRRRVLTPREWVVEHFRTTSLPVGHGFSERNLADDTRYYSFDPTPQVHCVVLDTVNPAGTPNGSLDAAQAAWLEADLAANAGKITLVFAHHTIATLDNARLGPADGGPRLLGPGLERLLWRFPQVIALVNGHSHANRIVPHPNPARPGAGFWEITTAAHIDWPQQSRLVELFDNGDGTLSLFATLVDHAAPPWTPGDLGPLGLAALARELALNDPQTDPGNAGAPADRNAELLVARPPLGGA